MEISDKLVLEKLIYSVTNKEAVIEYHSPLNPLIRQDHPSISLTITFHEKSTVAQVFNILLEQFRIEQEENARQWNERARYLDSQPRERQKTFIYVMLDKRSGYYKIGRSKDPKYRERTLQSETPEIEMLFHFDGYPNQEKALHAKYAEKRIRGEWFELAEQDLEDIKKQLSDD
jgi:hypothetical protein